MSTLNKNRSQRLVAFLILLFSVSGCATTQHPVVRQTPQQNEEKPIVIRSVTGNYDQVWSDLITALNDRGLVVSSVSHVNEMLVRTGKALHQNRRIFARAKVLEFCSAIISRQMMEKNPHYIAFCPYQIMVYSLPENPKKIYLAYRRLIWGNVKDRKVLARVEHLLSSLISEVVETQKEYR